MSLILDALNKADGERNKKSPPTLHSDHDSGLSDRSPEQRRKGLLLSLVAVALLALGLTIHFVFFRHQATLPSPQTSAPTQSVAERATPTAKSKRQQKAAATASTTQAKAQPKPKPLYQTMKEKQIAAQYKQAANAQQNQQQGARDSQSPVEEKIDENAKQVQRVAAIYQKKEKATVSTAKAKPAANSKPSRAVAVSSSEAVAKPAGSSQGERLKDLPEIRFIAQLPHSMQKNIPTIMYTAHNYKGKASTVTLNKNQLRKGQRLAGDLYLDTILVDGIVLRHDKKKFKMKALNSWVNL